MSKNRICPVCENKIPEDARFLCPHCHFELKWLDDAIAIQEAKQNFTGELFTVKKRPKKDITNDSISYRIDFTEFPKNVIFLFFWIVLNSLLFIMVSYSDGWSDSYLYVLTATALAQGVFYSVYFSKSTWQLFIFPIIWVLIVGFGMVLGSLWVIAAHYGSTGDFIFITWGILGIGFYILYFRNQKGCSLTISMYFGILTALLIIGGNLVGGNCTRCSLGYAIAGGIIYALISGAPFIYQIIKSWKKIAPGDDQKLHPDAR